VQEHTKLEITDEMSMSLIRDFICK
jgi:hypothetical protein